MRSTPDALITMYTNLHRIPKLTPGAPRTSAAFSIAPGYFAGVHIRVNMPCWSAALPLGGQKSEGLAYAEEERATGFAGAAVEFEAVIEAQRNEADFQSHSHSGGFAQAEIKVAQP